MSITEKLIRYFGNNVSYLSFILGKKPRWVKQFVYKTYLAYILISACAALILVVARYPPEVFAPPFFIMMIFVIASINIMEHRRKRALRINSVEEFYQERVSKMKFYLKKNKLDSKPVLKFLIEQIHTINKPEKQVPEVGFAVLLALAMYYSPTLMKGLALYSDLFKNKNALPSAEQEFFMMLYSNVIITVSVLMLYLCDKIRVLIMSYKFHQLKDLTSILQDIYLQKYGRKAKTYSKS